MCVRVCIGHGVPPNDIFAYKQPVQIHRGEKGSGRKEGRKGRKKEANMVSVKVCMCMHMYVCVKERVGRRFVCPPQVLRGFRFKQRGESHYLSDALPVFTHGIPKRLQRSFIPLPLPYSLLSGKKKKQKVPLALTNVPAQAQKRLRNQMALVPRAGLSQAGHFGRITSLKYDYQ